MAYKLTFANGTVLDYVECINSTAHIKGSIRKTKTYEFTETATSVNVLELLAAEGNVATLKETNDAFEVYDAQGNVIGNEVVENVVTDYTVFGGIRKLPKLIDEANGIYENRIFLELGELSKIEKQLKALGVEI